MDQCTLVMKLFWTDFHIEVCNLKKAFNSFKGVDILVFTTNIPNVIHFIKTKFTNSEFLKTICDSLTFWFNISKFVHTVKIHNKEAYPIELAQFEKNGASLYECGQKIFLTKNVDGDDKFFYSHVLRFYLSRMTRDIFNTHKVRLRVFTMQGYERRNKESENTMRQLTNNIGSIVFQNLKRLWDIIFHS